MSFELVIATAAITLALVLYTVGVFSEKANGSLRISHLLCFWGGLVCDGTGTTIMSNIASQGSAAGSFGIHAVTGTLALALMLVHALWATWVFTKGSVGMRRAFHRFSTVVWLFWLVPYIIGVLIGIPAINLEPVCAIGTSVIVVAAIACVMFFSSRPRKSVG